MNKQASQEPQATTAFTTLEQSVTPIGKHPFVFHFILLIKHCVIFTSCSHFPNLQKGITFFFKIYVKEIVAEVG